MKRWHKNNFRKRLHRCINAASLSLAMKADCQSIHAGQAQMPCLAPARSGAGHPSLLSNMLSARLHQMLGCFPLSPTIAPRETHTRTQTLERKATNPFRDDDYICRGFVINATLAVPVSGSPKSMSTAVGGGLAWGILSATGCFPLASHGSFTRVPPTLRCCAPVEDFTVNRQAQLGFL